MCTQRRLRSACSLDAFLIDKDAKVLHADNAVSDQAIWMNMLIWVIVGHTSEGIFSCICFFFISPHIEGWAQDYCNSNIFLKPLFRGNLDPFVNNANLGAIAHTSNGT